MMTKTIISPGFIRKSINALGIPPMNGPKNGMIFVTPMITPIKAA